jgi:hypothetical protein
VVGDSRGSNSKLIAFETGGHLLLGQKQKSEKTIDNFVKNIVNKEFNQ